MITDVRASTNITLSEALPFVYTLDSITETCNLTNGQASISITQGRNTTIHICGMIYRKTNY